MTGEAAALAVIDTLRELGIPYTMVGSFASNQYGIPRSTEDADFVIMLGTTSVVEIARRLGPGFRLDPQMSFETFTGTYRYELNVSEIIFRIELFLLSDDPYDQRRFDRRRTRPVHGRQVHFLSPEDVIVTKLRWARSKDLDDVRDVIAVQDLEGRLDWDYIHSWAALHGTRESLDRIRRSIPPI